MEKDVYDPEIVRTSSSPCRESENVSGTQPGWELLPEPLVEAMDNILKHMPSINWLYFWIMAGMVCLTAGLGTFLFGFSKPTSGIVLISFGFVLISAPVAFLKFAKVK
jgi:hypothetical protein